MRDAQKPDHISLNTLISRLKEGRFVIPDFQREFEWQPWDIKELMRSIFLDYYIGSLLLWKGTRENFESLSCEVIYGFDNQTEHSPWNVGVGKPEHIVLDGQQRLTALFYAFVAPDVPLPNRVNRAVYYIHVDRYMDEQADEAFQYDWCSHRFNKILNNRASQYDQHIFPLSIIGAGGFELGNWVQGYEQHWRSAAAKARDDAHAAEAATRYADNARRFGEQMNGIAQEYQIAYIELDRDLTVDKVCDIFTQINSRGIRLDVFDLINALLKPKGLQLKHMWREASPRLEFVEGGKMNVYVLQVMSILSQTYCSPKYLYYLLPGVEKPVRGADGMRGKEILIPDETDFRQRWERAVGALESAINLLKHPQEFGAISSSYLPYVSILPAFSALQATCDDLPASQKLDAQRKIRHWYWASVFTNQYSGAVESTAARDFRDVKKWMKDTDEDANAPPVIAEFKERLRSLDLHGETKKGSSLYNGVFNLLVIQGARDWMTGNVPMHGDLDDHHIVPVSWGNANHLDSSIHTILNRTPLTADTNRHVIRDRLPNEYLPELFANSSEEQVRVIVESHFISPAALDILLRNPFGPEDYEAFIAERQRTILEAIETLLIKERLDLSAPLRELDQQIEDTELGLRRVIAATLEEDPARLPPHIDRKLGELIQRAAKKSPTVDAQNFRDLTTRLEYADLRELQNAITSKTTWPNFVARFVNKETLDGKFGQLAELRNGIRHSRAVDQITRKEGEAALLWFTEILRR